jgi:hypothetical protein
MLYCHPFMNHENTNARSNTNGIPQNFIRVDCSVVASAVPIAVDIARDSNVVWLGRNTDATSSNGAKVAT